MSRGARCMRIFGFVHEITNPKLIERLHDEIPKTVDEMMRATTSFLRWEVVASNHERKKPFPPWRQQEEIFFPPLGEDEGIEGPMIIESEIGGHCIHRIMLVPLECGMVSGTEGSLLVTKPMVEERIKVEINLEHLEQTIMIGFTLTEEGRNKLCGLLQRNLDIFAWKPANMTGVPRHVTEHRLNVREGCSLVRQKKRGQAADRNQAIHEEL
nr:reverse transcriptase domain-containing protein [Tanacetum cinerariifolium]